MKDKTIVITGGSSGLGKGLAQLLVSKGNRVVICSPIKEEIEKTAREINAIPFVADVTKVNDMQALTNFAVSSFGLIDIWFNNAGVWIPRALFQDVDIEKIRSMFDVNVFGVMNGSKVAVVQMQKQGGGTIVNIISTSGLSSRPMSSGYASSKWAVRGFSDSIREENRKTNIKIISVYPGGMQTSLFKEDNPEDIDDYMTFESVAEKIVNNLEQDEPAEEQTIKRPSQM